MLIPIGHDQGTVQRWPIVTRTHAALDPHPVVPLVGASGAIAAQMGAFLVRFVREVLRSESPLLREDALFLLFEILERQRDLGCSVSERLGLVEDLERVDERELASRLVEDLDRQVDQLSEAAAERLSRAKKGLSSGSASITTTRRMSQDESELRGSA
jgi:hypothetical protein